MKHSIIITALLALTLAACSKEEGDTVVVPNPEVAPAPEVIPVPVPGPAGADGAPGADGAAGAEGAPGADAMAPAAPADGEAAAPAAE